MPYFLYLPPCPCPWTKGPMVYFTTPYPYPPRHALVKGTPPVGLHLFPSPFWVYKRIRAKGTPLSKAHTPSGTHFFLTEPYLGQEGGGAHKRGICREGEPFIALFCQGCLDPWMIPMLSESASLLPSCH